MGVPLILGALQVGGGIAGMVQGNQRRQQQKGFVDRAYKVGRDRLGLRQGDQRRSQTESLIARGLGTGLRIKRGPELSSPFSPDAGRGEIVRTQRGSRLRRPSTLGEQQQFDLQREQQLEQDALKETRDATRSGIDAGYNQQLVGQIGNTIAGGIQGYQTGQMYNAYKGIDPVDPLGRGAWANKAVDELNVFTRSG